MKRYALVFVLAVVLLLAMTVPALAGGKSMATGGGTWINGQGLTFKAEFVAQEAFGKQPAKGMVRQVLVDGTGGFVVDVDRVIVGDGVAYFGGNTVEAWGIYENRLDQYRWTCVWDGGTGTEEVGADFLRGSWQNAKPSYTGPGGNEAFSGGNVQVHYVAP